MEPPSSAHHSGRVLFKFSASSFVSMVKIRVPGGLREEIHAIRGTCRPAAIGARRTACHPRRSDLAGVSRHPKHRGARQRLHPSNARPTPQATAMRGEREPWLVRALPGGNEALCQASLQMLVCQHTPKVGWVCLPARPKNVYSSRTCIAQGFCFTKGPAALSLLHTCLRATHARNPCSLLFTSRLSWRQHRLLSWRPR